MYITQMQLNKLKEKVTPGKVIVIYGARRTGKTTLLKKYLEGKSNYLYVNGEDKPINQYLSSNSIQQLKDFLGDKSLLVIDEAQHIIDIGQNLKLIVDHLPNVKIIATGSSTFDLVKNVGEPLTGRKWVLPLYPLSQMELNQIENRAETKANLEKRLIFGYYPEVILSASDNEKKEYLNEIVTSYLYKDILQIEGVNKSRKIIELLQLLAFQIGKEVSYSELATRLGINKLTVEKYLDLLEQVFVLVNIRGFSRNLRREVTKTSRYYFCDLGIRNTIINNFNFLQLRDDLGALWENYLVIERIKKQQYNQIWSNNYFWRTYDQKELDWVEEREGKLYGYEFKWQKEKFKPPQLWLETYPQSSFQLITNNNYLDFIT